MYKIRKTDYGLHITMGGIYEEKEIEKYVAEKASLISEIGGPYSLIVDLRTAIPPKDEDAQLLKESQRKMRDANLQRMAIIVSSPVLMNQAKQIGFLAGVESITKYIDASNTENWEEEAMQWISEGVKAES